MKNSLTKNLIRNDLYISSKKKMIISLIILFLALIILSFFSVFIGPSSISFKDSVLALFNIGENSTILIIHNIRVPRVLAGLVIGGGLSLAGLIMQTSLNNSMASPSTLGVSNASVFGANIAIIILNGGKILGMSINYTNSYFVSLFAFFFAFITILIILFLTKIKHFSSSNIILTGVAFSSLFTALTTLLQYFANDVTLSSAIYWSFGDLSRISYQEILIVFIVIFVSMIFFLFSSNKYNLLLLGDEVSKTSMKNVEGFRIVSLLLSSIITAICISFVGIIGFIGLICPHIVKKLYKCNHFYLIIASFLVGSLLLLISDDIARVILNGYSLPVGAITSIIGTPFFLYIIFASTRRKNND